jgi:hypothetical protein
MTWIGRSLAAVAAVAVLHGLAWAYSTARLQREVEARLDGLHRDGWIIQAEAPSHAGWPFAAAVSYRRVTVDGAAAGVPAAWSADEASIVIRAAQPGTLLIVPSGVQSWRLAGSAWVPVTAASFELAADGAGTGLSGREVVLHLPGGSVGLAGLQAHAAGRSLQVSLMGIEAAPFMDAGRATLDAALTGPVPAAPDRAAAAAWRDGGGTVQVNSVTLEANGLAVSASGGGGLDANLQPVLDLMAQVRGHRAALDRLVQAGAIPASTAVAAKAVLGLLSGRDADAPAVVHLRLADAVASVAGFPLLRVPPLNWSPVPGQ